MKSNITLSDIKKIYFAGKAVRIYKRFKEKHTRATNLLNESMGVDDTYPPMIRVSSVKMWRNWKRLCVLLENWIKKDGIEKFKSKILLNTCVVVLKMMIDNEEKMEKVEMLRLDCG